MIRRASSDLHNQLQKFLKNEFIATDVVLEKHFSEIGRIADVVFLKEKLVIEIQTSLIRISEMLERQQDYTKLGYSVVWLLYDQVFFGPKKPIVTRFFYNKKAFVFSHGPQNRFVFYDLDQKEVALKMLIRTPPFFQRFIQFIFGF